MSTESDLRTLLVGYAGLSALVGSRVYSTYMPQKPTYPNIVYQLISRNPQNIMTGVASLKRDRFQFDIRAKTLSAVIAIDEQLRAAMNSATRTTDGFAALHLSTNDSDREFTVEVFRRILDFAVWSHNH